MSDGTEYGRHGFTFPFEWPPPRDGAGGPCWCNGPYSAESWHHEHCRKNRTLLRHLLWGGSEPHEHVQIAQEMLKRALEELGNVEAQNAKRLELAQGMVTEAQRGMSNAAFRALSQRLETPATATEQT